MKLPAACRALPSVVAWALGFALTARLAFICLPPAELPSTVREKLAHLAEHGAEYDAIFVGSSRIQNHIMPALFDRLTAEGGLPMKSFNAGVSSMHTPEDGWYLEQILARKPARLRWVFLEIDFFDTAQILRAGATPILVMPPRTRVLYFVPSAENAGLAPVVDLCRPAQYPELYDLRYRVDTSHFNVAGTEVFTRLAAARFLEIARPPAIH